MGIAVSNWRLARSVAATGQLGVVSGTVIDSVLVRRLQDGDPGGYVQRAMDHFPLPEVVEYVRRRFYLPEGRDGKVYRLLPMYRQKVGQLREQITMLASFVEVRLAKEGHDGPIGMNLLTKVQMPNLATLYGAMLAGVDVVLMGAGIPREIPGALDMLAAHEPASIRFEVEGMPSGESEYLTYNPRDHIPAPTAELKRPYIMPIVSAATLALSLARKSNGRVDGFVVEGPTAGGHNAPPRGAMRLSVEGEPIYSERDVVDLGAMRDIGLPFWLAGGYGSPEGLQQALAEGAAGVQVGTLFAYSDDSGFDPALKHRVISAAMLDGVRVRTDPLASPTGYPFKVVSIDGVADESYMKRKRVCDLGYLRTATRAENGTLIYKCAAEPVDTYVKKGGALEETSNRRCLCNGLMAAIGHGQEREDGESEPAIVTSGDDARVLSRFLRGRSSYRAADVVSYLIGEPVPVPEPLPEIVAAVPA
jgi:NAD(P)H-dependent flavin oxidoreductase YrpB (nitropropane dioxygenase family)